LVKKGGRTVQGIFSADLSLREPTMAAHPKDATEKPEDEGDRKGGSDGICTDDEAKE